VASVRCPGRFRLPGLRPDRHLDVFVVSDRPLEAAEKARIVEGLLPVSGRETRPPAWRPVEVTVVAFELGRGRAWER